MKTSLRRYNYFYIFPFSKQVYVASYGTMKPVFIVQLRLEEERCEEAEARVKELEKQVLLCFHIVRLCFRASAHWLLFG